MSTDTASSDTVLDAGKAGPDQRSVADHLAPGDSAPVPDLAPPDLRIVSDAKLPSGPCDPACQAQASILCVETGWGYCVECTSTLHCASNIAALGPKCNTSASYCVCSSSADCAKNAWGKHCDLAGELCGCLTDSDCGPSSLGSECEPFGEYCRCSNDTHCTSNAFGHKCDLAVESCSCATSADCPAGKTCTGSLGSGAWRYCE